jgi:Tfp pilus assembly protein PilF
MALDPSTLLQEAVRAVPAVKYALGIAGILAVLAIAKAFDLDPAFAIGGTVVVLALMVVLLIFARLSGKASQHFVLPALFLMWGSLALVLASAGLLFTSAFFGRPIDLRPAGGATAVTPEPQADAPADTGGAEDLEPLVELRIRSGDYAAAWRLVGDALQAQPGAADLGRLQVEVAEAWVRDVRVPAGTTFGDVIEPLLPALSRAAASKDPQVAADALAHLGFADSLRRRDGNVGLDPEPSYRKALELDPANPYAHAMLGHWLLWSGKPPAQAQPHFEAALASERARDFVRRYQIAALQDSRDTAGALALLRVCNEMRQAGEALDAGTRKRIVSRTYHGGTREQRDAVETALPAKQHLATLRWLIEDTDLGNAGYVQYFLARLSEDSGDCGAALPIYEALLRAGSTFAEQIEAGVARCRKIASGGTR